MSTDGTDRVYDGAMIDLFGTLVDFNSVFLSTLRRVLLDNGMQDRAEDFRAKWHSFVFQGQARGSFVTVQQDFVESLSTVLREMGSEDDTLRYAQNVIGEMFKELREAELFPEVPEVLAELESEGVHWAIVSNVDEEDLQAIVTNQGLRPTATISSERVMSYKPEIAIFQAALRELALPESRVLHVGDSPIADVKGAVEAGLDVMWVNRRGDPFPEDLPPPHWDERDLSRLPALMLRR